MSQQNIETAVFGGGCFWCTEAVFQNLRGIISVAPGYAGGTAPNPTYEQVSTGNTGHAEVIKIDFDPEKIKFSDLLTVFFATHDPTTLNRQGNDVGTQYRSSIFYANEQQKSAAQEFIKKLAESDANGSPVVTTIEPLNKFYEAEDYHHSYYQNNKDKPYCQFVIEPKVRKLQKEFADLLESHRK